MIDLGTLRGPWSIAKEINDLGQIVGGTQTSSADYLAFLYDDVIMQDLGVLGGHLSVALGINDKGQIVGHSETGSGVYTVFWNPIPIPGVFWL